MADQQFFTVKDVPAQDFIHAYADYLKKNNKLKLPEWSFYCKTGTGRQLQPQNPDWVYVRVAALARKIFCRGHWGVGNLKHEFGCRKKNGNMRERHSAAAGKIIRWGLQQLEALQVVKKDKKCELKRNSRIITSEGQKDLNRIATQVALSVKKQQQ